MAIPRIVWVAAACTPLVALGTWTLWRLIVRIARVERKHGELQEEVRWLAARVTELAMGPSGRREPDSHALATGVHEPATTTAQGGSSAVTDPSSVAHVAAQPQPFPPRELAPGESFEVDAVRVDHEQGSEFSRELVRDLFTNWCRQGTRARSRSGVEVAWLQFVRAERQFNYGAANRPVLADAAQPSEFVRFSAAGTAHALVYPNPDAHFSPAMAYVFAELSRASFENPESLVSVEPRLMRRRSGNEWELD